MKFNVAIRGSFGTYYRNTKDNAGIYDKLVGMGWTHEEAANAADWAELAGVGEIYEGNDGVEITVEEG